MIKVDDTEDVTVDNSVNNITNIVNTIDIVNDVVYSIYLFSNYTYISI
jgi:hypothetical protein